MPLSAPSCLPFSPHSPAIAGACLLEASTTRANSGPRGCLRKLSPPRRLHSGGTQPRLSPRQLSSVMATVWGSRPIDLPGEVRKMGIKPTAFPTTFSLSFSCHKGKHSSSPTREHMHSRYSMIAGSCAHRRVFLTQIGPLGGGGGGCLDPVGHFANFSLRVTETQRETPTDRARQKHRERKTKRIRC